MVYSYTMWYQIYHNIFQLLPVQYGNQCQYRWLRGGSKRNDSCKILHEFLLKHPLIPKLKLKLKCYVVQTKKNTITLNLPPPPLTPKLIHTHFFVYPYPTETIFSIHTRIYYNQLYINSTITTIYHTHNYNFSRNMI